MPAPEMSSAVEGHLTVLEDASRNGLRNAPQRVAKARMYAMAGYSSRSASNSIIGAVTLEDPMSETGSIHAKDSSYMSAAELSKTQPQPHSKVFQGGPGSTSQASLVMDGHESQPSEENDNKNPAAMSFSDLMFAREEQGFDSMSEFSDDDDTGCPCCIGKPRSHFIGEKFLEHSSAAAEAAPIVAADASMHSVGEAAQADSTYGFMSMNTFVGALGGFVKASEPPVAPPPRTKQKHHERRSR